MVNPYSIIMNSTESYSQKISFFDYLYVFMLIIYAGQATTFVRFGSFTENQVGFFLPIILSVILAIRWKIVLNKQFYVLIYCYFIYFIAVSIKYSEIHPTIFLNYSLIFFIVYVVVKALKFNLFIIYEYLIYLLAIIGLFMWGIQIILGGDTLYNYFGNILSDSFSSVTGNGLNAIFYSVQPTSASILFKYMPPRNCGFAWEPGVFAVYLCLAIFINLFFTNSDGKGKQRLLVLILALFSSQSTTGYTIVTVIILFYYLNKKLNIILLLLPVMLTALILIFSLPFMNNKIAGLINETNEIDFIIEQSMDSETASAPQRFSSFLIEVRDFYNNPILGLGGIEEESWTHKIGANIILVSGIGNLLGKFGLVGFLFFIITSFKTSILFSKYFNYKGKILLFLIILFISISYGIILIPLIMSFWMFQLFAPQNISQIGAKNTVLHTKSNVVNP